MKTSRFVVCLFLLHLLCCASFAQTRSKRGTLKKASVTRQSAVVVDERLSVVRAQPSLLAKPVRRLGRGRLFQVGESKAGDGVVFYKISLSSKTVGWIQSEAFIIRGKSGEDLRLFRLIETSAGFERIDRARIFLQVFADSPLRPSVLLMLGDLLEAVATQLSRDLSRKLRKSEVTASGAPIYSFYLNSSSLDRYVRLGLGFVYDDSAGRLRYDGRAWQEIVKRFPQSDEAVAARERLEAIGAR